MKTLQWEHYGPEAVLLRFADAPGKAAFERCTALIRELERNPPYGMVEYVPAFTTLLLVFSTRISAENVEPLVDRLESARDGGDPTPDPKEVPVVYDGPDLERVARYNHLTPEEVVRRHTAVVYRVHMIGFAPGFPYLGPLDPRLHTPRLPTPRTRVEAGSVAIGGSHTGIYTIPSPGGWNIIGRTRLKIFDPDRSAHGVPSMFLLNRGDAVRFVRIGP